MSGLAAQLDAHLDHVHWLDLAAVTGLPTQQVANMPESPPTRKFQAGLFFCEAIYKKLCSESVSQPVGRSVSQTVSVTLMISELRRWTTSRHWWRVAL